MYKVGIIGVGFGAKVYVPVLKCMDLFQITGVSDFGSGNSLNVINEYNLSCESYNDPKKLISSKKNNLICIVSPPSTHKKYIELSLKNNKHVICEKPIGLNKSSINNFYKIAKKKKLLNLVNYHFRFDDLIMCLKESIINDELGEINKIRINWIFSSNSNKKNNWKSDKENGGNIRNEVLSHIIDYLSFLIDKPITKLDSVSMKRYIDKKNMMNEFMKVNLKIKHINCLINIFRSSSFRGSHKILIKGSKKSALIYFNSPFDKNSKFLTFFTNRKKEKKISGHLSSQTLDGDDRKNSFMNMLSQITNRDGKDFLPNFNSAIKVWNILELINK